MRWIYGDGGIRVQSRADWFLPTVRDSGVLAVGGIVVIASQPP